jgi:hAT family C-terminal dimerisation region
MLLLHNATRWTSHYRQLGRFIQLHGTLWTLMREEEFMEMQLPRDVRPFREMFSLLQPFADVTVLAQGERYPTLCHVPAWIHSIRSSLEAFEEETLSKEAWQLREALLDGINQRFDFIFSASSMATCAAALTPAHGTLPMLDEDVRDAVWTELVEHAMHHTEPIVVPSSASTAESLFAGAPEEGSARAARKALVKEALAKLRTHWTKIAAVANGDDEELAAQAKATMASDPIEFWREASTWKTFEFAQPLLPAIRALLGTPATSASSESLFSIAGAANTQHRTRLTPAHLRMETLILRNLHLFAEIIYGSELRKSEFADLVVVKLDPRPLSSYHSTKKQRKV